MKYVTIPVPLQDLIKDKNIYKSLTLTIICAWSMKNQENKLDECKVGDRYGTRLSYTKLSEISNWDMPATSVKRYLTELEKEGIIKSYQDNKSYKFGKIYTYTDRIFEVMSKEEFMEMCRKYNSTYEKPTQSKDNINENYVIKNTTKKQTIKSNNIVSMLDNINKI